MKGVQSRLRVAIVTESFLPHVNGVTNSVRHLIEQLELLGHTVLVIAPGEGSTWHSRSRVVRVRGITLPGYRSFVIGLPDLALAEAIDDFAPDVVHLASPFVLGASGLRAARRRGIPTVAVFQTDVAGFARSYRVARAPLLRPDAVAEAWVRRLHCRIDRTLVPPRASYASWRRWACPTCTCGDVLSPSTSSILIAATGKCTDTGARAVRSPSDTSGGWRTKSRCTG